MSTGKGERGRTQERMGVGVPFEATAAPVYRTHALNHRGLLSPWALIVWRASKIKQNIFVILQ